MDRAAPVSKQGYVEIIRDFANDLQRVCRRAEATTGTLAEREDKLIALDLKFQ